MELREVFRTSGVRAEGFALARQHALVHYRRQVEDFGAPSGLCSSITESRHITAVKKLWRHSNRYNALGQMLQTNQHLDKLAAMEANFIERGMLPAVHPRNPQNDDDGGPVEGEPVLGQVVLAQRSGKFHVLSELLV